MLLLVLLAQSKRLIQFLSLFIAVINAWLLPKCDRHVRAFFFIFWDSVISLSPRSNRAHDILTPIRQPRNYLFVFHVRNLRKKKLFLFCFDECAPILQPNLKVSVNLLNPHEYASSLVVTFLPSHLSNPPKPSIRNIKLEGISFGCLICDPLQEVRKKIIVYKKSKL